MMINKLLFSGFLITTSLIGLSSAQAMDLRDVEENKLQPLTVKQTTISDVKDVTYSSTYGVLTVSREKLLEAIKNEELKTEEGTFNVTFGIFFLKRTYEEKTPQDYKKYTTELIPLDYNQKLIPEWQSVLLPNVKSIMFSTQTKNTSSSGPVYQQYLYRHDFTRQELVDFRLRLAKAYYKAGWGGEPMCMEETSFLQCSLTLKE